MFGHGVFDDVKSSGPTNMSKAGAKASLTGLPDDILLVIFSFVDVEMVEALLQVRCPSTIWCLTWLTF